MWYNCITAATLRLTLSGLFICQFSAFAVWRYFAGAEIGAKR
jgi:hypothetical protein